MTHRPRGMSRLMGTGGIVEERNVDADNQVDERAMSPRRLRIPAILLAGMLALSACAADDTASEPAESQAGGGGGASEPPAESDGGDGEISFDLSGIEITTTSTLFSGLDASLIRVIEIVEGWGAEVDNVVLSQQSGLDAILADESNIAGSHDADELIIGVSGGEDLLGIGSAKSKMDYVLVAQGEYATVEDLEGTTIATSGPAGFNTLLMRFALEDAGLDPDNDVELAQIGSSGDRASALLAGAASSAALTIDDWFELQEQTEELQILAYFSDVRPEFPNDIYYARTSYWNDSPDLALAWACANLEANAWITEDEDRYVEWIAEYVDAPEASLRETWQFAVDVDMWPTDPEQVIDVEGVQALADILLEIGDISEPVNADEIIDLSYLQEAGQMGCGQG
jgi:NitT/TauT family transport system substrate-binding protein